MLPASQAVVYTWGRNRHPFFRIIWLHAQASTRHCEVRVGPIYQRKKLRLGAASFHEIAGLGSALE